MGFFDNYGLFLLKVVTILIAILAIVVVIAAIAGKGKMRPKEKLEIKNLNKKYKAMKDELFEAISTKSEFKKFLKLQKSAEKHPEPSTSGKKKKIFVVDFHGDIKASASKHLREEITAILTVATPEDEVVVCLESAGGMVHSYGLAASQLRRLRQQHIPLTIVIDKVAASGGYLMACVGNRILAAPFAIIGSIGVVAQLPNFHKLLQKNNIDFEQVTAGEYKRTVSLFGKITEKGREKFQEEIEEIHHLFKKFVVENRQGLDIEKVATGEHWFGTDALQLNLIDDLSTSDDYLLAASKTADIYKVCYSTKKSLFERFGSGAQSSIEKIFHSFREQNHTSLY